VTRAKKDQRVERIPKLLQDRLKELEGTEFELPAGALGMQAVYDRVLVWQFPDTKHGSKTFGDGLIIKPPSTVTRHLQSVPRGIVISVGLGALDAIRSNGMDVGHVILFCVNSPYRIPLDDNDQNHLVLLRAGDIIASEDLARALDEKECFISEETLENGDTQHVLVGQDGKKWGPQLPWMEE
jgi:hypothetical protein